MNNRVLARELVRLANAIMAKPKVDKKKSVQDLKKELSTLEKAEEGSDEEWKAIENLEKVAVELKEGLETMDHQSYEKQ